MNPSGYQYDRSARFFCLEDIDQAASVDGIPWDTTYYLWQPTGWPGFSTSGWSYQTVGLTGGGNLNYGYGFGTIMPSDAWREFAWTDVTTSEHPVDYCGYVNNACTPTAIPGSTSEMRPAVAYDTKRGQWWAFWRDRPGSPSNTDDWIIYSVSSDLVNWSPPEPVWFSFTTPVPLSRVPVGATYDWYSDSIVVVFANWNAVDTANGSTFTCSNGYGCSGELNLATISGGAVPGVNFNGPWDLGVIATGPPTVACEYSGAWYECQVLFNGETLHRNVQSLEFGLDSNGTLFGTTLVQDMGGWTDTPIGLTFNGPNEQGEFVGIITEASPQGLLSFMEKPLVEDSWGPWQYTTMLWSYWPPSHLGPTINVHEGYQGYDVLFGQ